MKRVAGTDLGGEPDPHGGFREAFALASGGSADALERERVVLAWMDSPLGPLVAGATERGVCLLEYTDRGMLETQIDSVRKAFAAPVVPGTNAHLDRLREELASYFAGSLRRFSVPLTYPGTPFQVRVWEQLLRIPYGETRSYEGMAEAIGQPRAVRAVGRANGLNRIVIVIPCHRVVNKDGRLCGYGGGLWRKRHLLNLERTRGAILEPVPA